MWISKYFKKVFCSSEEQFFDRVKATIGKCIIFILAILFYVCEDKIDVSFCRQGVDDRNI